MPNMPLFFLAFPMLAIMFASGRWAWHYPNTVIVLKGDRKLQESTQRDQRFTSNVLRCLAVPHFGLVLLAFTTYHVQIITRLSSGYPLGCWAVTSLLMRYRKPLLFGSQWNVVEGLIRWMVIYALIQAGLFGSFLPPA